MDVLAAEAERYASLALAPTTSALYTTALRSFSIFCAHERVSVFPLEEVTLIRFVSFKARFILHQSIQTYLTGIQFHASASGFSEVIGHMYQLSLVMKGIRRRQAAGAARQPKSPITLRHLFILVDFVSAKYSPYDANMLRTAMSLAFYGMLRVSEYTASGVFTFQRDSTLTSADVQVFPDFVVIFIKKSKTDPFKVGTSIRLTRCFCRSCPVSSYTNFRRLSSARDALSDGPLFTFSDGSFLSRSRLSSILRVCFRDLSLSTHSFRIGGASAAASAGIPDAHIQILGR